MPRQKNQATVYLEIYQLAVEKNRLEAELQAIEKRKVNISQRLEAIAEQIDFLGKSAHEVKGNSPESDSASAPLRDRTQAETTQDPVPSPAEKKSEPKDAQPGYHLETMTLDY
jgi:hypothetical protein